MPDGPSRAQGPSPSSRGFLAPWPVPLPPLGLCPLLPTRAHRGGPRQLTLPPGPSGDNPPWALILSSK